MSNERKSIALIGLSGVGKSTIAPLLAEKLAWPCFDTDGMIVEQQGKLIAEIFALEGEKFFRDLEAAILRETFQNLAYQPCVLATGGGIILREANRKLLQAHTYRVWLDAPLDLLVSWLEVHQEERPLLTGDQPAARLAKLHAEREPIYRVLANQRFDTSATPLPQVADAIIASYLNHC